MQSKIYISGPITGIEDFYIKFRRAEKELQSLGYIAINPAAVNGELPAETSYEEYMRMSLVMLDMCDSIYMLRGWEKSIGANREYGYALAKDKTIILEKE